MLQRVALTAVAVAFCSSVMADDAAKVERGKVLFTEQKCKLCHSVEGKGNAKGPMDDVGGKLSAEDLRKWLVNPKEMSAQANAKRQPPMKAVVLPPDDLDALVAYMLTLKKEK